MAKKPKVLKKDFHVLPVKLSEDEIRDAGTALAQVCRDLERLDEKKREAAAHWKGEIAKKIAARQRLSDMVSSGTEERDVECHEILVDEAKGTVAVVRLDTGERIAERTVTQSALPLDEEGA